MVLPSRPAAVVFDCDGLLVDTEPSWVAARAGLVTRRGFDFGPAQQADLLGVSPPDTVARMVELMDLPGREEELLAELLATARQLIAARAVPMPGAPEFVRLLADAGVPLAVASNSPREVVEVALAAARIPPVFSLGVFAEDAARPKPAPDPFLVACARLGCEPAGCLAFEDSPAGVASAVDAGLFTIGVLASGADQLAAHHLVESLADAGLLGWVASWSAPGERT